MATQGGTMKTYNPDESGMTPSAKALNALYYEIGRQGFEHVDNLRVAQANKFRQRIIYNKTLSRGCCGYFDSRVTVDGIEFLIGCNYGH